VNIGTSKDLMMLIIQGKIRSVNKTWED